MAAGERALPVEAVEALRQSLALSPGAGISRRHGARAC